MVYVWRNGSRVRNLDNLGPVVLPHFTKGMTVLMHRLAEASALGSHLWRGIGLVGTFSELLKFSLRGKTTLTVKKKTASIQPSALDLPWSGLFCQFCFQTSPAATAVGGTAAKTAGIKHSRAKKKHQQNKLDDRENDETEKSPRKFQS